MLGVEYFSNRFMQTNRLLHILPPIERMAPRAAILAKFLEAPINGPEHARVVEVFKYCQQLGSLDPDSRSAGNIRRAINAHVSELRVAIVRQQNGDWDWKPLPGEAGFALKVVADLESNGLLNRMRQCEVCSAWFFAGSAKKLVCRDACRQQKLKRSDPEAYRQKRAESMRAYRGSKHKRSRKRSRPL